MTEEEVKNRILEVFQSHRKKPSAGFDESHFMDFLTDPAHQKNTIKNSFRGVKKYYRFMDALELEFRICFSLSDLDTYYSVDKLTQKVLERIKKGKGNNRILQRRNEEKNKYILEAALVILLVGIFYWQGISWISILAATLLGTILYRMFRNKIYQREHLRKMKERFEMDP